VKEAAHTTNRQKRMEMYRLADRMLIQEQVVMMPLTYAEKQYVNLVKPWVKNCQISSGVVTSFQNIVMEDHG
jgi:ABC-type oligopeptide transport system substrate-binding subunit